MTNIDIIKVPDGPSGLESVHKVIIFLINSIPLDNY